MRYDSDRNVELWNHNGAYCAIDDLNLNLVTSAEVDECSKEIMQRAQVTSETVMELFKDYLYKNGIELNGLQQIEFSRLESTIYELCYVAQTQTPVNDLLWTIDSTLEERVANLKMYGLFTEEA